MTFALRLNQMVVLGDQWAVDVHLSKDQSPAPREGLQAVITSYSIHYTKLYECFFSFSIFFLIE